jgi:hypothetical protein
LSTDKKARSASADLAAEARILEALLDRFHGHHSRRGLSDGGRWSDFGRGAIGLFRPRRAACRVVLFLFSALVAVVFGVATEGGKKFRRLFVGADNRWSTSKLQVVLWTYTILLGLSSPLIAKCGETQLDGTSCLTVGSRSST